MSHIVFFVVAEGLFLSLNVSAYAWKARDLVTGFTIRMLGITIKIIMVLNMLTSGPKLFLFLV